jgi:hypothetical protein
MAAIRGVGIITALHSSITAWPFALAESLGMRKTGSFVPFTTILRSSNDGSYAQLNTNRTTYELAFSSTAKLVISTIYQKSRLMQKFNDND